MNKYLVNLFLVITVFFTGCLKEQENLFSEPAAVRLNGAIEGIDSSLTHAPNGWLMQYFATSQSPGYSMLVRFSATGEVIVAAKNELVNNNYTEAKSFYDVIGDNGPVLTFNTYNDVLHIFSNPVDPNGTGLNGDYEFIVLDNSDSIMHLKGKKRGTNILMQKLPVGISWVNNLEDIQKIDDEIFGSELLYLVSGSDIYFAKNGATHIFQMQLSGDDDVAEIPFIVTREGLKFHSPFTAGTNKKVQSFYISSDRNKLISREDKNTYFVGADLNLYLENSIKTYVIDTTRISDHFKNPIRVLCQQMKEKYSGKRNIDFLALSYKAGFGHSFYFSTTPTITAANFSIEFVADKISSDVITINKVDKVYDPNGAIFISNVAAIDEVWQSLEGSYQLFSNLSRKEIKFVDKNDPTRYFYVIRR